MAIPAVCSQPKNHSSLTCQFRTRFTIRFHWWIDRSGLRLTHWRLTSRSPIISGDEANSRTETGQGSKFTRHYPPLATAPFGLTGPAWALHIQKVGLPYLRVILTMTFVLHPADGPFPRSVFQNSFEDRFRRGPDKYCWCVRPGGQSRIFPSIAGSHFRTTCPAHIVGRDHRRCG